MMFNSAGLHPDTVGAQMPSPDQFTQYRATGDPLTGVQNNAAVQTAIVQSNKAMQDKLDQLIAVMVNENPRAIGAEVNGAFARNS